MELKEITRLKKKLFVAVEVFMKKLFEWDSINKWLYIGSKQKFTIMFDNWCWISKKPTIRQWSLFDIMWDNGVWWGDLPETKEVSKPYMEGDMVKLARVSELSGKLSCFVQITIFGIGFRYWYEKEASVYNVFPQIEDE